MNSKLLSFFFLTTLLGFSQTDIQQLHSTSGSQFTIMSGTVDQTASGANASWDFTSLTPTSEVLTDVYTDNGATSSIETFEGTTLQNSINLATDAGVLSFTGIFSQDINGTYTDTGIIGTFPLSFNYTNTDGLEGAFTSDTTNGNILNTSTINVNVDAWGNLKVGTFDGEVTRLVIIQNLDLNVSTLNFPGTLSTYYYYDANSNDIVFRFTRLQVTPPIGAPVDDIILESLSTYTLSNNENSIADVQLSIATNPVANVLKFKADSSLKLETVSVFDITGRAVLRKDNVDRNLDVTSLTSGIYVAIVATNKGVVSKRFVKQ